MTQPKLANLALWGEANAFNEARAYRDPRDGKHYPSITSILKLVDKPFLSQYAANETLKWAVANWTLLGQRSDEQAVRLGKYRWKDHRDTRAMVGDGVHNYIEALQTGSWDFPELDAEQTAIIDQFALLCEEYEIEPIYNEVTVADVAGGWFGTYDSYCKIDGVASLVDFKTSASVHDEHRMQLAALANAKEWFIETSEMKWEVVAPEPIDQVVLFHLRADHREVVVVDDLDLHFRKFQDYADIWYANEELRARKKEKEAAV